MPRGITNAELWKTITDSSAPQLIGIFLSAANGVVTFTRDEFCGDDSAGAANCPGDAGEYDFNDLFFDDQQRCVHLPPVFYQFGRSDGSASSNWTALATSVMGNGLLNSITDTSPDASRFYRVGVH